MKIPKKFEFMGKTWSVIITDDNELLDGKWGITRFRPQAIFIAKSLSPQTREETFLHELLHVLMFQMGLQESLKLGNDSEEILVNTMSAGLFGILKEVKWLS